MHSNSPTRRAIVEISLLALFLVACGNIAAQIGYTPPLVPLHITVDSRGRVEMSVEGSVTIPTFLGEFDVGVVLDPTAEFNVPNVLVIRINGKDYFYDLHGGNFQVTFSSGYYEEIAMIKTEKEIRLILRTAGTPSPVNVETLNPGDPHTARQFPSIWNGINFHNLPLPGMNQYSTYVDASQAYRWSFYWCSSSPSEFNAMVSPISVQFYVDGMPVNPSDMLVYDTNGKCRNWATILHNWQPNTTVQLDIRYHLSAPVPGGYGANDIGDYTQRIEVTVR